MAMFCFKCGADVSAQDTVCPVCGAIVNRAQESGELPPMHQSVSFRDRAAAFGIDVLVMLVLWYVLFRFFYGISFYLLPVVFVGYYTVCVGARHAASFSQRCMGMRVVNTKDGGHPGYLKAFLRALVMVVSIGLFGLGCFLSFVTKGQMLHDIVSGTQVVRPGKK
jgi:uncharacterized RDD family membrane protein YckC